MHIQKDSGLCAHTGGFQALCTHRRFPSSVHKRVQALCTKGSKLCAQARVQLCAHKGSSSVHTQEDSKLCAQKGSALCTGRGSALCTGRGSKLCVQARVQALCTKGSKLCAQARVQLCAQARVQALCTDRRIPGSVHKQEVYW